MPLTLTNREVQVILLGLGYVGVSDSIAAEEARNLVKLLNNNLDCKHWILHEDERKRA